MTITNKAQCSVFNKLQKEGYIRTESKQVIRGTKLWNEETHAVPWKLRITRLAVSTLIGIPLVAGSLGINLIPRSFRENWFTIPWKGMIEKKILYGQVQDGKAGAPADAIESLLKVKDGEKRGTGRLGHLDNANKKIVAHFGYDPKNKESIQKYLKDVFAHKDNHAQAHKDMIRRDGNLIIPAINLKGISGFLFVPDVPMGSEEKPEDFKGAVFITAMKSTGFFSNDVTHLEGTEFDNAMRMYSRAYTDLRKGIDTKANELALIYCKKKRKKDKKDFDPKLTADEELLKKATKQFKSELKMGTVVLNRYLKHTRIYSRNGGKSKLGFESLDLATIFNPIKGQLIDWSSSTQQDVEKIFDAGKDRK